MLQWQFEVSQKEIFHNQLQQDSIRAMRLKAWDQLSVIGLPNSKNEAFHYFPLKAFYNTQYKQADQGIKIPDFSHAVAEECQDSYLVFVNGEYREELSNVTALPKELVILPLTKAMRTYASFLQNHWNQGLKNEKNPFVLLNAASHQKGLFIYVPPNLVVEKPIQILNIIEGDSAVQAMPRMQVFSAKHSSISFFSKLLSFSDHSFWSNVVYDFVIESGANAKIMHVAPSYPKACHFETVRSQLKRDASFKSINITEGGKGYRLDHHVVLADENATAELYGAGFLKQEEQSHQAILMEHQAPHCYSNQLFKCILYDKSRSSFEGKIYVHPIAQKTNAYQLNNHLILSDEARADSKPNLEIFADDVKASHGATTGQLDAASLFYLRTRGIPKEEAKKLLIQAFQKNVIDNIFLPSVYQQVNQLIAQRIASED